MKLNSKTRDMVKVGTVLRQDGMTVRVTNVIELRNGKQITVQIIGDGRQIYAQPLSYYYGMEVVG